MATSTKKTAATKRRSNTKTAKKPATKKTTKSSSSAKPTIKRASTPKRKRRPMHPELKTAIALLLLFIITLAIFPLLQWAATERQPSNNILLEKPTLDIPDGNSEAPLSDKD